MHSIRLLDLGLVPPIRSQTIYHAVGHALAVDSPDTIILVAPDGSEKEINLADLLKPSGPLDALLMGHGRPPMR